MGFIRSNFLFIAGTLVGAYVAQNYNIPNIKKLANSALDQAKIAEQNYRKRNNKPGSRGDDDDAV